MHSVLQDFLKLNSIVFNARVPSAFAYFRLLLEDERF